MSHIHSWIFNCEYVIFVLSYRNLLKLILLSISSSSMSLSVKLQACDLHFYFCFKYCMNLKFKYLTKCTKFHWIWWCIHNFFLSSNLKGIGKTPSANVYSFHNVSMFSPLLINYTFEWQLNIPAHLLEKTASICKFKLPTIKAILSCWIFIIRSAILK